MQHSINLQRRPRQRSQGHPVSLAVEPWKSGGRHSSPPLIESDGFIFPCRDQVLNPAEHGLTILDSHFACGPALLLSSIARSVAKAKAPSAAPRSSPMEAPRTSFVPISQGARGSCLGP